VFLWATASAATNTHLRLVLLPEDVGANVHHSLPDSINGLPAEITNCCNSVSYLNDSTFILYREIYPHRAVVHCNITYAIAHGFLDLRAGCHSCHPTNNVKAQEDMPPPPYPLTSSNFDLFLLFPFSFSHSLYLFSSFVHTFPFSTRVVPLHFQAGGCRRRTNLGLVCCVYFVLSVLLS